MYTIENKHKIWYYVKRSHRTNLEKESWYKDEKLLSAVVLRIRLHDAIFMYTIENKHKIWYYAKRSHRINLKKAGIKDEIIERSGSEDTFDARKITAAVTKANYEVPTRSDY